MRRPRLPLAAALCAGLLALGGVFAVSGLLDPGAERSAEEPEAATRAEGAERAPALIGARPAGRTLPPAQRVAEPAPGPADPGGPVRVEGQVLDEAGRPLAGARVTAVGAPAPAPEALTDAEGRFALDLPPPGTFPLRITADGRAEALLSAAELGAAGRVTLGPGPTLSGVVLDAETEAPIAGLPVTARRVESPSDAGDNAEVRSGEDGAFVLPLAGGGAWMLQAGSVWRTGGEEHLASTVGPVEAGARGLRVLVRRGAVIEGQVVDASGALVALPLHVTAIGRTASGDSDYTRRRFVLLLDGRLRIPGLAPGRYDLHLQPARAGAEPGTADAAPTVVRNVEAGTTGLLVRLGRGSFAAGRVLDDIGEPVLEQGSVHAFQEGRRVDGIPVTAQAPGDGTFRVGPLEDGLRYELVGARFGTHRKGLLRGVAAGDRDLVLIVPRGGRIAGRVLDAEGRPAPPGVPVGAVGVGVYSPDEGWRGFGMTQADGRFEITGLGEHVFEVQPGGGLSAYLGETATDVKPGTEDLALRVSLGVALEGTLEDAQGAPVSTTSLSADDGTRRAAMRPYVQVGPDGRFRLQGLKAGPVRLFLMRGGKQVAAGEVEAPGTAVKVLVPPE